MARPVKRVGVDPDPSDSATWFTTGEVAKLTGFSRSKIKSLEGRLLHPVIDVSGTHRYHPDEVKALQVRAIKQHATRVIAKPGPVNEGELAAAVFKMIAKGVPRNQIIIKLAIAPTVVDELWEQYTLGSFENAAARRRQRAADHTIPSEPDKTIRQRRREQATRDHAKVMASLFGKER